MVLEFVRLRLMRAEDGDAPGGSEDTQADRVTASRVGTMTLPLPEPGDISNATLVNFEEIEAELNKLSTSIAGELHRPL